MAKEVLFMIEREAMDYLLQIENDLQKLLDLIEQEYSDGGVTDPTEIVKNQGENQNSTSDIIELPKIMKSCPLQNLPLKVPSEKKFKKKGVDLYVNVRDLGFKAKISLPKDEKLDCTLLKNSLINAIKKNEQNTELHISLDREKSMKTFITDVCKSKEKYGHAGNRKKDVLILHSVTENERGKAAQDFESFTSNSDQLTMEDARVTIATEHLKNLYQANGYSCHVLKNIRNKECFYQKEHGKSPSKSEPQNNADSEALESEFITRCRKSQYRDTGKDEMLEDKRCENDIVLDLGRYLQDLEKKTGCHCFDKNIKSIKVKQDNKQIKSYITDACQLEHNISSSGIDFTSKDVTLLHVAPLKLTWDIQIASFVWKLVGDQSENFQEIMMCPCGPCSTLQSDKGENQMQEFEQYLRYKCDEVREAYMARYGSEVKGEDWEGTIRNVSLACIKFDILLSPLRNKISFKTVGSNGEYTSSRESLFVLYNYSRLCNLLRNFEKEVSKGNYPPLPDAKDVEFSCLREEAEWRLFVKYILQFPILVNNAGTLTSSNGFLINPSTNKICLFLTSLAKDLSSYYHQIKILLDPRPHLFPLMFARIYLVIAIKQVMLNSFQLIGITPPTQM